MYQKRNYNNGNATDFRKSSTWEQIINSLFQNSLWTRMNCLWSITVTHPNDFFCGNLAEAKISVDILQSITISWLFPYSRIPLNRLKVILRNKHKNMIFSTNIFPRSSTNLIWSSESIHMQKQFSCEKFNLILVLFDLNRFVLFRIFSTMCVWASFFSMIKTNCQQFCSHSYARAHYAQYRNAAAPSTTIKSLIKP